MEEEKTETFTICVPGLGNISSQEGMKRLSAILQGFGVDCELDPSGTHIVYGPGTENDTETENEFIQTLINIFDARLLVTHQ